MASLLQAEDTISKSPSIGSLFCRSESFSISCSCVAIDRRDDLILLSRSTVDNSTRLPRAYKTIDEGLLSAGIRAALETTGFRPEPLRLHIPTRAQPVYYGNSSFSSRFGTRANRLEGNDRQKEAEGVLAGATGLTTHVDNCEPIAVCQYREARSGSLDIVFYFLASADRTAPVRGAWEGGKSTEVVWATLGQAAKMLSLDEERRVLETAAKVVWSGTTSSAAK